MQSSACTGTAGIGPPEGESPPVSGSEAVWDGYRAQTARRGHAPWALAQHSASGRLQAVATAKQRYVVVLEEGPNNWGASVPDVWGCVSTGRTRAEAERNIRAALEFHFESLRDHHEPIPAPGTWTTEAAVEVPESLRASPAS